MTEHSRAVIIQAQLAIMDAEKQIMLAENREREGQGLADAHGPEQWAEFHKRWEGIVGWNAAISFIRGDA